MAEHCSSDGNAYDRERGRRRREVRARSVSSRRTTRPEFDRMRADTDAILREAGPFVRPRTRGDCIRAPRPCPFVSCQYHLYLDVSPRTGSVKLNFPDLQPWELEETCALDVAERGGAVLEDVGALLNVTRERIRQIEVAALLKLLEGDKTGEFREMAEHLATARSQQMAGYWEQAVGGEW